MFWLTHLLTTPRDRRPAPSAGSSILLAAVDREANARVQAVLEQAGLDVEVVEQAQQVLERTACTRYDIVVSSYPLPDMVMRDFVDAIRLDRSPCRDTPLLLLTSPEMRTEACLGARRGPFRVLSRREPQTVMRQAIAELLRLAPRRRPQPPVAVKAHVGDGGQILEGMVVDVSASGMLVAHDDPPPVSCQCRFTVELGRPTRRFAGTAEVVRHPSERRERVRGFALRFLDFSTGSREQLHEVVVEMV